MKKIIAQHPDNILHCNTDCVVSNIPLDLPVSTKLGEFKLEHDGENFRYYQNSYQWEGKIPSKKGVPRGWWRENDSLLGTGSGCNKYYFDWGTKELKEYEEKQTQTETDE